ncbi:hypothetical protein J2S53_001189 [Actinopolyspora lacussalsi]|nr:hypothetical protein [Actinopolyspora lacussalsi]
MWRTSSSAERAAWHELRARCDRRVESLLRSVELPDPWDIDEFIDGLERHRRRDVDLCAVSWHLGDSTGAWQRNDDHDVIAYPDNTSTMHQDYIILHEIGHMISGHHGRCVLSVQEAQRRAPDLSPTAFAHLLHRGDVTTEEHEAETIATLIFARITRRTGRRRNSRRTGAAPDDRTAATLARLTSAFDQL